MTELHHILSILSPFDFFLGVFSFATGLAAAMRILKKSPVRNASIFLQIALLITKMAKYYFDSHPEAKEKLNTQTLAMMEKLSGQLQGINDKDTDRKPVG